MHSLYKKNDHINNNSIVVLITILNLIIIEDKSQLKK
jgi:hypothetical protein